MNFSKDRCLGQEWRRLLEAAEKTVSRSFLCLGSVVSQSVMPVELFNVSPSTVRCRENVWLFWDYNVYARAVRLSL